ncbi:DUF488 family protein, N3 subclade [Streptomyces sp. NPDC001761]
MGERGLVLCVARRRRAPWQPTQRGDARHQDAAARLRNLAGHGGLTLLTATRDTGRSHAAVLAEWLTDPGPRDERDPGAEPPAPPGTGSGVRPAGYREGLSAAVKPQIDAVREPAVDRGRRSRRGAVGQPSTPSVQGGLGYDGSVVEVRPPVPGPVVRKLARNAAGVTPR